MQIMEMFQDKNTINAFVMRKYLLERVGIYIDYHSKSARYRCQYKCLRPSHNMYLEDLVLIL